MSSKMASEGDLNAIVKEYLKYKGLEKTTLTFERECSEKGAPISPDDVKPKANQKLSAVQTEMLETFDKGRRRRFFDLWTEHVEGKNKREDDLSLQKIEFYVCVYFAIYPLKYHVEDSEDGMQKFKRYLESNGPALSRIAELTQYYALPFVSEPETHATFSVLFTDEWSQDLRKRLDAFLKSALRSLPQPRLFDLYSKGVVGGSSNNEAAVAVLEQKTQELERKSAHYLRRFNHLQSDYHNLIGITASLVDTLEETVQGVPVTPEYLQTICNKLFTSQVRQTADLNRPGTAGKLLRQSVNTQSNAIARHESREAAGAGGGSRTLSYAKIKADLTSPGVHYRTRGLLLQALRWKLTKTTPGERNLTLAAYISNDLLGCLVPGQYRKAILEMLRSDNDNVLLRQYMARLLNTFASLSNGRGYLARNGDLITALIGCLQTETRDIMTRDNALGCLQKLSLRRQLQNEMIDRGVINWLVKVFHDTESISDYMLEYAIALMMNLCLRTAGKQKCSPIAGQVLRVLVDLLNSNNKEVLPYVNGTLYSILAIPNIRKEARAMGLVDTLRLFMKESQPEMNRQFDYIIKEIQKTDDSSGEPSDDEDDDEEEDQDVLEADLDKNELIKSHEVDHIGDSFLNEHYMESSGVQQRKKKPADSIMASEDVLRRPVTPGNRHLMAQSNSSQAAPPPARKLPESQLPPRSVSLPKEDVQRPPTRSGSRPSSASNAAEAAHYRSPSQEAPRASRWSAEPNGEFNAFNARPKIPRTPDNAGAWQSSRASPSDGPPPQPKYSDSLPRPGSGPGARLNSQTDKKTARETPSRQGPGTSSRPGAPVKTR